jgi:hypothetical protein
MDASPEQFLDRFDTGMALLESGFRF